MANSNSKIYEVKNDSAFLLKDLQIELKESRTGTKIIRQMFVDTSENIFVKTNFDGYKLIKKKTSIAYKIYRMNLA